MKCEQGIDNGDRRIAVEMAATSVMTYSHQKHNPLVIDRDGCVPAVKQVLKTAQDFKYVNIHP